MALRFNKRVKIAPGIKVNVGLKGVTSATVGGRGASVNIGKKGTHLNAGLPGTGISTRTKISGSSSKESEQVHAHPENTPTKSGNLFWKILGFFVVLGFLVWLF